jgi:arginyl-tRNA--protein-N-Asp/Glu arginylyltransferase
MHFVPECKSCTKCVSMRIDVANYKFSKSEKRVIAKNKDTKLYIRPPSLTMEHLSLYDKYHKFMNDKKDWPYSPIDPNDYENLMLKEKKISQKNFYMYEMIN